MSAPKLISVRSIKSPNAKPDIFPVTWVARSNTAVPPVPVKLIAAVVAAPNSICPPPAIVAVPLPVTPPPMRTSPALATREPVLAKRLDHHRGQGQQQIVVKHITVNADQAVVTDTVVAGKNTEEITAAKLLVVRSDKPMEVIEPAKEALAVGGDTDPK